MERHTTDRASERHSGAAKHSRKFYAVLRQSAITIRGYTAAVRNAVHSQTTEEDSIKVRPWWLERTKEERLALQ